MLSPVDPASPPGAAIFGFKGPVLTAEQKLFFRDANPLGFILFGINDNIHDPAQLAALTASLQDLLGRTVPILIDQEGGRVARLKAPHWPVWPTAKSFGDTAVHDLQQAVQDVAAANRAIAVALRDAGITVNCAPVLDIAMPKTHAVIGDRAFSDDPAIVATLGIAACEAYLAEGIIPVVKHIPGHGRATADSHAELPVVGIDAAALHDTDLVPYYALLRQKFAKNVWCMVAHVIYTHCDSTAPASCSAPVMAMIRRDLGFDGFLLSDDIVMGALSGLGDMGQRAAASVIAGCDAVLHCNGEMGEMKQVAAAVPMLSPDAVRRFNASLI